MEGAARPVGSFIRSKRATSIRSGSGARRPLSSVLSRSVRDASRAGSRSRGALPSWRHASIKPWSTAGEVSSSSSPAAINVSSAHVVSRLSHVMCSSRPDVVAVAKPESRSLARS